MQTQTSIPATVAAHLRNQTRATRIAVLGASNNPEKYGNVIVRDLDRKGYTVLPINPKEPEIAGLTAYPDAAPSVRRMVIVGDAATTYWNCSFQNTGEAATSTTFQVNAWLDGKSLGDRLQTDTAAGRLWSAAQGSQPSAPAVSPIVLRYQFDRAVVDPEVPPPGTAMSACAAA